MSKAKKKINLALQGGGAHGAFTWGVLDAFLADGRIEIAAISGTSAGAMNAAVLADGLKRGGPERARAHLTQFWRAVSEAAKGSPIQRSPLDMAMGRWTLDHAPGYVAFGLMTRFLAPNQFNPLQVNPLRDILVDQIDFDNVCDCGDIDLFVAATNVETGRVKIFDRRTMTPDKLMASACLPFLFDAVEIDGDHYWDGGYAGNPPLFPFYKSKKSRDIVIVQINPVARRGAPATADDIHNRVNEITFNASLLKEMRSLYFIDKLLKKHDIHDEHYKEIHLHLVECQDEIKDLGASSKLNAEWDFLVHLHDIGQEAARGWLARAFDDLGKKSTVDLAAMFEGIEDYD